MTGSPGLPGHPGLRSDISEPKIVTRPCQEDDSEGERNHKKLLELIQQERGALVQQAVLRHMKGSPWPAGRGLWMAAVCRCKRANGISLDKIFDTGRRSQK